MYVYVTVPNNNEMLYPIIRKCVIISDILNCLKLTIIIISIIIDFVVDSSRQHGVITYNNYLKMYVWCPTRTTSSQALCIAKYNFLTNIPT